MAVQNKSRGREERVSTARRRAETHVGGFSRTTFKVPEGMSVWQPKAGETYTIDILPYKVGKRKFAQGITFADPGFEHFERTFFNHARIGPNEDSYVCLAKTFDKPCPICEYRGKISKDGATQDEIKALYSKERQLFCIYDHAEKNKGPQLWEVSFHLFGKLLDTRIKSAKGGRYDGFYFPDKEGRTLEVTFVEKSMGANKFSEVVSIDFTERDEEIPEEVLAKVPCLDDLIIEVPYDKLKQIFLQEPESEGDADSRGDSHDEDADTDEKPAKKKPKDDDEDFDDEPKAKKKPAAKDDDDLVDDEDGDQDDDEPKAKKKPAKDDEDDFDDDDADEKPVKKKKAAKDDDDDDKREPTAKELGLKEGMEVTFEGEKCKIVKVSGDGTSLTLKEVGDGTIHKAIGPDRIKIPKAAKEPLPDDDDDDPKPTKKKKPAKDDEDDFDDD